MRFVEVGEFLEGVFADDVGVEDEEGGVVFAEDLLSELERPGSTEGFGLDGELYSDIVLLLILCLNSQTVINCFRKSCVEPFLAPRS
jgi:hypothetical protein